jgi:hypothetical protein
VNLLLILKNTAATTIAGWTFRVDTENSAAPHASISMPGLELRSGAIAQVPLNLELTRAPGGGRNAGTSLTISLDGVLFTDGSAYGPDTLHTLRTLGIAESENKEERQYLTRLLRAGRLPEIRQELNFGLPDAATSVSLAILPRSSAARSGTKRIPLAALALANAPVEISGEMAVNSDGVVSPGLTVRNVSTKTILSANIALLVRDEQANEFIVANFPELTGLLPGKQTKIEETELIRLSRIKGPPLVIRRVAALITAVEFANGSTWVPSRADIERTTANPELRRILSDSPERRRLAALFRRDGMNAVSAELKQPE